MDLKTVHVKNVVPVSKYEFVTSLHVKDVRSPLLISSITVDGQSAAFIRFPAAVAVLLSGQRAMPASCEILITWTDGSYERISVLAANNASAARVTQLHSTMLMSGAGFSSADEVWINGKPRAFARVSHDLLMATFPESDATIDSIEVVVPDERFQQRAVFRYSVAGLRTVSGPFKVAQNLIVSLLGSQGSDIFDPPGALGDLNKWPGSNAPSGNQPVIYTRIILAVQKVAAYIQASQALSTLPSSERLASVSIVGIDTSPNDPTKVSLLFKVATLDGQVAQFNTLIAAAKQAATTGKL